jgi:hypothetical protein
MVAIEPLVSAKTNAISGQREGKENASRRQARGRHGVPTCPGELYPLVAKTITTL